jgi:PST family polysaccharide transporter
MLKIATNMASLFISVLANRIFPILLFPYLARTLGPESFGKYVQASAFSFLIAQIVEWGFNMTAVRQVSLVTGENMKVGKIVATVALSRVLIGIAVIIVCILVRPWIKTLGSDVAVFGSAMMYGLLYAFDFRFAFYGLQETKAFLILTFVQYLVSFMGIVLLVRESSDIWIALIVPAVCSLVSALVSLRLLRKWALLTKPSLRDAVDYLRGSVEFFFARNIFQISNQMGVLVLGLFAPPQLVGWLGASERISRTVGQLVIYPVQIGLTPVILKKSKEERGQAIQIYLGSLVFSCAVAAVAGAIMFFYAGNILELILGSAPEAAINTLKILSFYPVIFILINQGGIFWLYLMNWDRANVFILTSYTILSTLVLTLLAYKWQLAGVSVGLLALGSGLVLAYSGFFIYRGIAPWRSPLGEALKHSRPVKTEMT